MNTGDQKILVVDDDTIVDQALFKPFTLAEMDVTVQGLLHP